MTKHSIALMLCFCIQCLTGQQSIFLENKGVFRWTDTKKEIRLLGVNYNWSFALGYRAINYARNAYKYVIDKYNYHKVPMTLLPNAHIVPEHYWFHSDL